MNRLGKATLWSVADVASRQGMQLAVMVVLARLLTPGDFGTIALLALFIGIASVVVDGGFSTSLIQRAEISQLDKSTVFWLSLATGFTSGGLIAAFGPAIAAFYDEPALVQLSLVLGVNVFVSSLGSVQTALLTRDLDFRPLVLAGLTGSVVSGIAAVVIAANGGGVWSLAWQAVVMTCVSTATVWVLAEWRPSMAFSSASLRRLAGFGGFVLLANLVDVAFARLYTVVAGRHFGVVQVGYYNRADAMQQLPVDVVGGVASRLLLPILSSRQDDPASLRNGVRSAAQILTAISAPIMCGIAALADPIVSVVLGPQWGAVVPLLQILCLAAVLWPLQTINIQVLLAQGHSRLLVGIEVIKKSAGVALLVIGATWSGLIGMAWSQVAFAVLALGINGYYTGKFLKLGAGAQLLLVLPVILVSAAAGAAAFAVLMTLRAEPIVELAVGGSVHVAALVVLSRVFGIRTIDDAILMLRGRESPKGGRA